MERHLAVNIFCEVRTIADLDSSHIEAMWNLFDQNYINVRRETFERDLLSKHQALMLWKDALLTGFTSQLFLEIESHRVLYSGDVIIAPEARGLGTAHFFKRGRGRSGSSAIGGARLPQDHGHSASRTPFSSG
ncbi:MAG: hypothetical protein HC904_12880 [Blastochloris sp.]|nr:hypothetical protein [Blastochloris sp.]